MNVCWVDVCYMDVCYMDGCYIALLSDYCNDSLAI